LIVLHAVLALLILSVCLFAPGFYFVRRLDWNPLEKLCGSVALSVTLLWLAAWSVYLTGIRWEVAWGISAACVAVGAAAWRDAAKLVRGVRVTPTLVGFGFLLGWVLVLLCVIRNYSGAVWKGDWLEHFQRSLFFLHRFPVSSQIIGNYALPARPPAMNVLAAFVMAQAGDRFEVFQVAFAFLNVLLFLPCAMALPLLSRSRRQPVLPLVVLFAASPVLMQNATYMWTKSLAAFFVIFGILMYLRACRKDSATRIVAAFLALGMGLLVHYSAGPYLVFLAIHYLFTRRGKWKELAWISGLGGALLATWFAWSISTYGVHGTVASNTSVTGVQEYQGSNLSKIGANLFDSAVPHLLRDPEMANGFPQSNPWGHLRDHLFVIYQSNLIFCIGSLAGPIALWLLIGARRQRFWIALVAWSVVIGIAVAGEREPLGLAHLTLLPITCLALTLVASRFTASRTLAIAIVVGCGIDFLLGVYLHVRVEHLENTPGHVVFAGQTFADGRFRLAPPSEDSLSAMAWENWLRKHQYRTVEDWSRSIDAYRNSDRTLDAARAAAHTSLDPLLAEDDKLWHGWYRQHGGEIEFLGDHFGGFDAISAMPLVLFAGLLLKLIHSIPPKPQIPATPKPKRKATRR
jgi:hypothetical protein